MTTHYTLDGKKISLLGYGAMRLPTTDGKHAVPWLKEGYSDKAIDQELLNRQVKMLLDGGVTYFDTSPAYCRGESEAALGNALKASGYARKDYVVATKLSNFAPQQYPLAACKKMFEDSLKFLQTDYIDNYLLHSIGSGGFKTFSRRYLENGALDWCAELRAKGRIRRLGFSYHDDAPLDMRMNAEDPVTAAQIVNERSEDELNRIFRDYGEEKWARQIARVICDRRRQAPIVTTSQLVAVIDAAIPKKFREKDGSHPARRVFQALRIAVNDELDPLADSIRMLADMLKTQGRLCVITFHSLEDRIVKNTFRELANPCTCPPEMPVCVCGKKPTVKLITRKPITASAEELAENPRSRSASLRVLEKI